MKEEKIKEEIPLVVKGWKHTDKYPCPKCGKKLPQPYFCEPCNIQLKVKVQF